MKLSHVEMYYPEEWLPAGHKCTRCGSRKANELSPATVTVLAFLAGMAVAWLLR